MANTFESYVGTTKPYVTAVAATLLGASGTAVGDLPAIPYGYCARLIRYSIWSNSSGTPVFELFTANARNFWLASGAALDRSTRQDYSPSGKNDVSDNNSPPFFDEGEVPVFVWTGCSNGDTCQASILVALFEKVPVLGHRDMTAIHHQEQIEDKERNDVYVVPGSGWQAQLPEQEDSLEAAGYGNWAARDPMDAADNPAQPQMGDGMGQYVGGNELGPQHPSSPFRGHILPDHSVADHE